MRRWLSLALVCGVALLGTVPSRAQSLTQSAGASVLAVIVVPQCSVEIVSQSPPNANGSQTVTFTYRVRTSASGGGQIFLQFTAAGLTAPVTTVSNVDYQSQIGTPALAQSGSAALSNALTSGIVIGTIGAEAHSSRAGSTGTLQFSLPAGSPPVTASLSISCQ